MPSRSRPARFAARFAAHFPGKARALVFVLAACSGGGVEQRPVASLATTADATVAFDGIREAWENNEKRRGPLLRPLIEGFLGRYPRDGRAPMVRAYMTFLWMDEDNWVPAEALLLGLEGTPPGTTGDLVTVARARWYRHKKKPEAALELLRPLVGKIVDDTVRELFLEEITRDALESRRDYEVIAYMDAWLRGVSEDDREEVRARVVLALGQLPDSVLEATYRAMRKSHVTSGGNVLGYGGEIQRLVGERLAETAITRGDPTLARWLLDTDAGPSFIGGDAGVVLGEIATSRRGLVSVAGRTIGLLLPTGSPDLRDEAAEVARGVSWALELPRVNPAAGDSVRLVTRDDGGDPKRTHLAMEELAGEGAAVIIGGLDPDSSDRVLRWGERHSMPVIVLAPPRSEKPGALGFTLGEPIENEMSALADALAARGIAKAAVVASPAAQAYAAALSARVGLTFVTPVSCEVETTRAGEPRFPVASWAKDSARGWIVAGTVECARDLLREVGASRRPGVVALTLEGSATAGTPGGRPPSLDILSTTAGIIPLRQTPSSSPSVELAAADVRAYMKQYAARPSWWTALGRDAGKLARSAVAALPLDTVSEPQLVAERRVLVNVQLPRLKEHLWTTELDGFAGTHSLQRTINVVEIPR